MIPVMQLKAGGPDVPVEERGDCLPACLCSILELPAGSLVAHHGDDEWWAKMRQQTYKYGFEILSFDPPFAVPAGYWIADVPSLNLGCHEDGKPILHCVVMRGYKMAHDPALAKRYKSVRLPDVHGGMILVKLVERR